MKKITKLESEKSLDRPKRVCAYARVSCEKDAMLQSLSAQVSHYNALISGTPGWEFAGVYADEGISGTKEDRPEFLRMMADARAGKIDVILTKSISRFARNTASVLRFTRELKALGVDVYFESQRMHTMSEEGEFMLSVLASFYQEEARSMSENMRWRIRKEFEKGMAWGGCDPYGYRLVGRKLEVNPEQAPTVRRIFSMYVGGMGSYAVAKRLNAEGIPPLRGKRWSGKAVLKIVSNPEYVGDRVLQTTYRKGYMGKSTKMNRGELRMYYVEGDHEPIIDRATFEEAQRAKERRRCSKKGEKNPGYPLTGKVRCGACGGPCKHKRLRGKGIFVCSRQNEGGKAACPGVGNVSESSLEEALKTLLKTENLGRSLIEEKIEGITVRPGKAAEVSLKDGSVREVSCADRSRKESWTPEMRAKARKRALAGRKEGE